MAIGRLLNAALVNDSAMQTAQSLGHSMIMLDQITDRIGGFNQTQMETLGFVTADATDMINLMAQWSRGLAYLRGQMTSGTFVQENFRPFIKQCVGINF